MMNDDLRRRLCDAGDALSLDRTRICEDVAARLVDAGTEPAFEVGSADFEGDPFLICADRYWRRRFLELPTVLTAAECARWLGKHVAVEARAEVEQKWSQGYAFITRDTVESRNELDEATGRIIEDYQGSEDIALFAALYHGGKLRADFRFAELGQFLESAPLAVAAGDRRHDTIVVALLACAALGSPDAPTGHAHGLLERAWTAADATRQVVDVCLHGLWAAPLPKHNSSLLCRYATEAVSRFPEDATIRYRLAVGQRRCGQYAEALHSIDAAFRLLPGSHSFRELQSLLLTERVLILEGQPHAALIARLEERSSWCTAQIRRLRVTATRTTLHVGVAVAVSIMAFGVGASWILTAVRPVGRSTLTLVAFGTVLLAVSLGSIWWLERRGSTARIGEDGVSGS